MISSIKHKDVLFYIFFLNLIFLIKIEKYESKYVNRFIKDEKGERLDEEYALSDIFSGFMTKVVDNPHK